MTHLLCLADQVLQVLEVNNIILLCIASMYGIFNYIWVIYGINVSKYAIHGASGSGKPMAAVYELCVHGGSGVFLAFFCKAGPTTQKSEG